MNSNDNTSDAAVYRRLLTYTHWGAFFLSIFGFMLYSIANVGVVQLVGYLVDSLQGSSSYVASNEVSAWFRRVFGSGDNVNQTLVPIAIVAIVMLRGVGTFIGNYFISYTSTNMIHNLRCELFDRILSLPSSFYDRNALGHLVTKVTFHVTQVTGAATEAVKIIIREGLTVIAYLGFLLYLNWKLTLLFFAVAPLIAILVGFAGKRFRRISERIQDSMGDVTHVASEAIQGYREVRTFGGADYERDRFGTVSQVNRRQSMKMVVTSSIATPVVQVLVSVALAGLVWLVLDPAIRGSMTTGDIVAFISTGGLLAKPIRQLSEVNATVQRGLAAAKDIFHVFDEPMEPDSGSLERERIKGKVEFRNVSFRYGDDQDDVLRDISFVANPGETIALVGRSGSGKSTIASLIPRFYSAHAGQILVDDTPVEDFRLANLRSHMSIVSQQVTLFNDTVRRNIAYGGLNGADDDAIRLAAERAFAWDFIERLDDGLDTLVGDDGVLLSGGQRQRLAIARAFLKDSPVLILDEATSALDSESERYIQQALDAVVKGRTTIVIAHRLSTIEKADRILVIEEGRIVEQGSHDKLLEQGGYYARLHRQDQQEPVGSENDENLPAQANPALRLPHAEQFIQGSWYGNRGWTWLLWPLAAVFQQGTRLRRWWYESGERAWRAPVPVIVIGNITVGGAGKTPLVAALAEHLAGQGLHPGIILRGYGGQSDHYPVLVTAESDPAQAGDEAVMLAASTGQVVVVDPDRVRGAKYLLAEHNVDVIISDDGLQHYQLGRQVEVAVIDGERGLGNRQCLPAGPLREPPSRLKSVDFVVSNGPLLTSLDVGYEQMKLVPQQLVNLATGETVAVAAWQGEKVVHAVAGIGNPARFFAMLHGLGFTVIEHPFADHHVYRSEDLNFADESPILMTAKDAVKCRSFATDRTWVVEVKADLHEGFYVSLMARAGLNVAPLKVITNESKKVSDGG